MEEMHHIHKETAWGWIGVLVQALTVRRGAARSGAPSGVVCRRLETGRP